MSNNYFQFKQFTVQQEMCAMKVCTDACSFGAWIAEKVKNQNSKIKNVLDIGTGTGLLSLMLAQKSNANIDAVETDESAATQAGQNFAASPWKERLKIYNTTINEFKRDYLYDLIISNPPFFENDLKSSNNKRNLALHSSELTLEELLQAITLNLKNDGHFAVLLPYHRTEYFETIAKQKYFLQEKVLVKQTPGHDYFRSMLLFSPFPTQTNQYEIIIREKEKQYSNEFTELLKEYYLYL